MKNILAVIAGLIISVIIFSLFEFLSTMFNPLPTEIELSDKVAMKEYISTLPISSMIIILAGYALGSFLTGVVIGKISKSPLKKLPLIAGSILTIAAIINLVTIPAPVWFMIINILLYIPLTVAGNSVSTKINN